MRSALTRSRAAPEAELTYLIFNELMTVEEHPEQVSHVIAWRFGNRWVALIPVRFAQEPVVLLAIPAGTIDLDVLPKAPGGAKAVVQVIAVGSRARCKVAFVPMPQDTFDNQEFCSAQDVEDCGLQVRGFGGAGTHLPVAAEVLETAMGLGFTADEEHAWATCDDDAEFGAGEDAGDADLDRMDQEGLAAELRVREAEMQQSGEAWEVVARTQEEFEESQPRSQGLEERREAPVPGGPFGVVAPSGALGEGQVRPRTPVGGITSRLHHLLGAGPPCQRSRRRSPRVVLAG